MAHDASQVFTVHFSRLLNWSGVPTIRTVTIPLLAVLDLDVPLGIQEMTPSCDVSVGPAMLIKMNNPSLMRVHLTMSMTNLFLYSSAQRFPY